MTMTNANENVTDLLQKMSNEQKFIDGFNFLKATRNISDLLHSIVGIPENSITLRKGINNVNTIELQYQDFAPIASFKMFSEINIVASSSDLMEDDSGNPEWFIRIAYRYRVYEGGSNGHTIANVWFNQDGSIKTFKNWME